MIHALVTRPKDDAQALIAALEGRGFAVLHEALLEIRPLTDVVVDLAGVQGILATSANGVRALASCIDRRDLPVWCVGDATARAARDLGFAQVESAGGDVNSLAALVREKCDAGAGALLHGAASVTAGDLGGQLAGFGFDVRRIVLYQAQAADDLSDDLKARLKIGGLAVALFHSPRTAKCFADLVQRAGLAGTLVGTVAYCLSQAVADALDPLVFATVRVAPQPTQDNLLSVLDTDMPGNAMSDQTEPAPQSAPAPETDLEKGTPWGGIIAGLLVAAALAGGAATFDDWKDLVLPPPQDPAPVRQAESAPPPAPMPAPEPVQPAADPQAPRLAQLENRLDQAEALRPELERLSRDLAELKKSSVDAAFVLRLAERVEKAEAQVKDLYGKRTQTVLLLLAVGQLNDAVARSLPFDSQWRAVKALAPQDAEIAQALDAVRARAVAGIPTATGLVARFPALSTQIIRAQILPDQQGWLRQSLARLAGLVTIRREDGQAEGDGAAAILARAGQALNNGDLAAAAREMDGLSGSQAEQAAPWLKDVQDRLTADRALSELTAHVLALVGAAP